MKQGKGERFKIDVPSLYTFSHAAPPRVHAWPRKFCDQFCAISSKLDVTMLGITSEQTRINASKLTCREYLTLMQKQELGRPHAIDATVLTMVPLMASDKVAEHVA